MTPNDKLIKMVMRETELAAGKKQMNFKDLKKGLGNEYAFKAVYDAHTAMMQALQKANLTQESMIVTLQFLDQVRADLEKDFLGKLKASI